MNATAPSHCCHVCGGAMRRWFARRARVVCVCPACGHIAVPQGLARGPDGLSIYESADAIFNQDGNIDYYLDETNALAARRKARFVRAYAPSGRLLDVGASFGHFLAAIRDTHDAYGVEVSRAAVTWSVQHLGVRSVVGNVYDLDADLPASFDAITAWDIVEHLEDPRAALRACRARLRPGRWLFLSTPDAGSPVARVLGRYWHYMDPVQHIHLFTRRNLVRLLEETGFRIAGWCYFGHEYRINYVINRLHYLSAGTPLQPVMAALRRLPKEVRRASLPIKLWDVVGIAARRADVGGS